jgi:membrane-bound metal-dependent hydrolase YbcI (DUF457 family)
MDNVTHTLIGVTMANAGLAQRFGRGTVLVMAVASNLPDLDAILVLTSGHEAPLERRTLTHSLIGLPLLALAGATIFRWFYQHISWRVLFGLCLLAMAVHLFFDLVNSYGVVLLYPFSRGRFELAWVFIIDLILLGLLLGPLVSRRFLRKWISLQQLSRISIACIALYVGFCALGRAQAGRILERMAALEGIRPQFSYVFPEALGPHRFRGVLKEESQYKLYLIPWLSGEAELIGEFATDENDPLVQQARASKTGERLEWFFKAPVWRRIEDSPGANPHPTGEREQDFVPEGICKVFDLRFQSVVFNRGNPFVFRFRVEDGEVEPLGWR